VGKVTLYIDDLIKEKAKNVLERNGRSLSSFLEEKLIEILENENKEKEKEEREKRMFKLSYSMLMTICAAMIMFVMVISFFVKNIQWLMFSGIFAVMVIVFNAMKEALS